MPRRREIDIISMSFLDAITCGFGAVILFFMIVSANVSPIRGERFTDRTSEARRLALQVDVGRKNLVELREALETVLVRMAENEAVRDELDAAIASTQEDLRLLLEDANASEEAIEQLRGDLERLETEKENLAVQNDTIQSTGNYIREVRGEGYRQYLTGMRMGGQRILILVDVSASMMGRNLVEIVEYRVRDDEAKRQAPKWRQVVDTIDWLTAQIPTGVQFQVIAFNRVAWSVVEGSEGQWITATDGEALEKALDALNAMVPGECPPTVTDGISCGGTSLHAAFAAMGALAPRPDNVFLIVDGLPTMGEQYPSRLGVNGNERLQHFQRATRGLPTSVPINVLLYALEGDPMSAAAYWALSLQTGGSLMAPSEDWP